MSAKLSIGDNIRIIRENLGYSQEYMSSQLNITQQAYSHIEKNADKITVKRLKEIAKILDVKVLTLLDEENVYVQQNFNQKGGYAATLINMSNNIEAYEKIVAKLEDEIVFLRDIVKNQNK